MNVIPGEQRKFQADGCSVEVDVEWRQEDISAFEAGFE